MGEEWSFLRPDFVGRLTPLTFREGDLRVPSENREFSAAEGTSWASICRSAAFGCGGSIPSLPTDFFNDDGPIRPVAHFSTPRRNGGLLHERQ
jgi:hypothetical protein